MKCVELLRPLLSHEIGKAVRGVPYPTGKVQARARRSMNVGDMSVTFKTEEERKIKMERCPLSSRRHPSRHAGVMSDRLYVRRSAREVFDHGCPFHSRGIYSAGLRLSLWLSKGWLAAAASNDDSKGAYRFTSPTRGTRRRLPDRAGRSRDPLDACGHGSQVISRPQQCAETPGIEISGSRRLARSGTMTVLARGESSADGSCFPSIEKVGGLATRSVAHTEMR